jgi:hypothetical protein
MRRALRSPRALAGAGVGLGLLIALVAWFLPYLTRERTDISGVPVPPPFFAQERVHLGPGSEACLSDVAFDTDSEIVELTALASRRPTPALTVVAEAPGYRRTASVQAGYAPPLALRARLDPPERSVIGTLCIRNRGDRRVALLGTTDVRTVVARPMTRIDGVEIVPDISVRLLSGEGGSVLERVGEMVDRAAAFKPGLFGAPVLLWLVLLLVAFGIPAGAVYSMLSSFRESE